MDSRLKKIINKTMITAQEKYMETLKLERFIREYLRRFGITEAEKVEQMVKDVIAEHLMMYEPKKENKQ